VHFGRRCLGGDWQNLCSCSWPAFEPKEPKPPTKVLGFPRERMEASDG
jgi:hypothetical protein